MRRIGFGAGLIVAAALAATCPAAAQPKLGPKDSASFPASDLARLKAGDEAPDFTLEDQDGRPVTLSDYRGKKTVVVVFYRGFW